LDEEHVPEIDFGRGDDGYKSAWARQRRQRIGLMFANPLHPRGVAFLGRHALGRARAALLGSAALGPRLRGDDEKLEPRG